MFAFGAFTFQANAAVIQHQADRYVINVDEMDLNGEETLLDILMMLPDVMTVNGRSFVDGGVQQQLFGQYAVRVDNMNIQVNAETFAKNTKARDIKCVKICTNPGVQKGCGGLKQVIDIYYVKHDKGNEGRVAVEADTYGKAGVYATDWKTGNASDLHVYGIGNLENQKINGVKSHASQEQLRAHYNWNISDKDNMIITAAQSFTREKEKGGEPGISRSFNFDDCYTRDLGNGAYAMFQAGVDYNHENTLGKRALSTNPYALIEFGAPFISKNLYLNGGIESGYSAEKENGVTSKFRYEDIYAQLDWNCGKFNLSVGDRVRFNTQYFGNELNSMKANHTATTNHVTVSSWVNINEKNTIQATFARRFYGPSIELNPAFTLKNSEALFKAMESPIYTTEVRYSYDKKDFTLMAIFKNLHVNNYSEMINNDNIMQIGATAFWHTGILRLTAGISYNHQRTHAINDIIKHNNFVHLKLVPQVSLENGWRFTSTMLYNSRKNYDYEIVDLYTPANFYVDLGVSKEINEHWLVEAKYHDIAGQKTGNRAATVGFTYAW